MELEFLIFLISMKFLVHTSSVLNDWPNNLKTKFSFPTRSPIDIDSSRTKPLTGLSPLTFTVSLNDKMNVSNNGKTIVATPIQSTTKGSLTGSILKENKYLIRQVYLVFSDNYKDSCGTTIDGKGTPIHMVHVLVKKEYNTIEKAKTERDGMVIIIKDVLVTGTIPNRGFDSIAKTFKKLKNPGSSVVVPTCEFYQWYDQFGNSTTKSYYMYPGTYVDPKTGEAYESAVVVVFVPIELAFISIPQFQVIQGLQAEDNLPMSNPLPNYEMNQIPVIQAEGIRDILLNE